MLWPKPVSPVLPWRAIPLPRGTTGLDLRFPALLVGGRRCNGDIIVVATRNGREARASGCVTAQTPSMGTTYNMVPSSERAGCGEGLGTVTASSGMAMWVKLCGPHINCAGSVRHSWERGINTYIKPIVSVAFVVPELGYRVCRLSCSPQATVTAYASFLGFASLSFHRAACMPLSRCFAGPFSCRVALDFLACFLEWTAHTFVVVASLSMRHSRVTFIYSFLLFLVFSQWTPHFRRCIVSCAAFVRLI